MNPRRSVVALVALALAPAMLSVPSRATAAAPTAPSTSIAARALEAGEPVVTGFSVASAPIVGGTEVEVTGANFDASMRLALGDAEVTNFAVVDAGHLRFTVPPQKAPGVRTFTVLSDAGVAQAEFRITPEPLSAIGPCEITTVVGGLGAVGAGVARDDGHLVMNPDRVALDAAGDVYVADSLNHRVRRIDARTGIVTTVAGSGRLGYDGDGGLAVAASLYAPHGVTLDAAGNVFIADSANNRVRRVDVRTGLISTVAGTGAGGFAGDGVSATAATLYFPSDLDFDAQGNLYVADTWNGRVRRVDAETGVITTVAGRNGFPGADGVGDGGPATAAYLSPSGIGLDSAGVLYVADGENHSVRRVDPATHVIATVAGGGHESYPDPNGEAPTELGLEGPSDVIPTGDESYYIADGFPFSSDFGGPTTLYGVESGAAHVVKAFNEYAGNIAIADDRTLVLAHTEVGRVQILDAVSGLLTDVAGSGKVQPPVDYAGGTASLAHLGATEGIAVDGRGTLFVDAYSEQPGEAPVFRVGVDADVIAPVLPPPSNVPGWATGPLAIGPSGDLFLAEYNPPNTATVYRVKAGKSEARAILGGGWQDPAVGLEGTDVSIFGVSGVAATADRLFVAFESQIIVVAVDTGVIVRVLDTTARSVATSRGRIFAGTSYAVYRLKGTKAVLIAGGRYGYGGDGGPAVDAGFDYVRDIAADRAGNVFVIDDYRLRRVDAKTGIITTIAGANSPLYAGDSGPAASATFEWPERVAVGKDGVVYVAGALGTVRAIKPGCDAAH